MTEGEESLLNFSPKDIIAIQFYELVSDIVIEWDIMG